MIKSNFPNRCSYYLVFKSGYLIGPFDTPGLAIRHYENEHDGQDFSNLEGKWHHLGRTFIPRVLCFEHEISDQI